MWVLYAGVYITDVFCCVCDCVHTPAFCFFFTCFFDSCKDSVTEFHQFALVVGTEVETDCTFRHNGVYSGIVACFQVSDCKRCAWFAWNYKVRNFCDCSAGCVDRVCNFAECAVSVTADAVVVEKLVVAPFILAPILLVMLLWLLITTRKKR